MATPVPFIEQYERFLIAEQGATENLASMYAQARAEIQKFITSGVPLSASDQAFYGALQAEVDRLSQQAGQAASSWIAQSVPTAFVEGATQHAPGIAFNIIHDNAVRALSAYSLDLIQRMDDGMRSVVRQQIGVGLLEGATRQTVSQRLLASGLTNIPHWRTVEERAAVIARTEIMRAYNRGNLAGIIDTGAVGVRWYTGHDERVCSICGPRHGKVFRIPTSLLGITDAEVDPSVKKLPTIDPPPAHPRCRCTIRAVYDFEGETIGEPTTPAAPPGGVIEQAKPIQVTDEGVAQWMKYSKEQIEATLANPRVKLQAAAEMRVALERINASFAFRAERGTVEWAKSVWGTKTGSFYKRLSPTQMQAVTRYSGSDFKLVNRFLRKGTGGSPALNRRIDALQSAIDVTPLDRDLIFSRGTTLSAFDGFHPKTFVGKTITEPGFMSTSLKKPDDFLGFEGAVRLNVTAPKGTRALYMEPVTTVKGEQEILFGRGTIMRVTNVVERRRSGKLEYVVDVTIEG